MPKLRFQRLYRFIRICLLIATLITFSLSCYWARNTFFLIQTIQCEVEDETACPPKVVENLSSLINTPLLWTNLKQKVLSALATTDSYQLISYRVVLPQTLHLQLTKVSSAYSLLVEGESRAILAGHTIITNAPDQQPPAVLETVTLQPEYYFELLQNPAKQRELEQDLNHVVQSSKQHSLQFTNLRLPEKRFIIFKLDSGQQVIVLREELSTSLYRLFAILPSISEREDFAEIKEIDLRYTFPVLRKEITVL